MRCADYVMRFKEAIVSNTRSWISENYSKIESSLGTAPWAHRLGERGVGFGHPYARANLSHPEMVAGIHEEYLRAGASVIETNTFSANRYKPNSTTSKTACGR